MVSSFAAYVRVLIGVALELIFHPSTLIHTAAPKLDRLKRSSHDRGMPRWIGYLCRQVAAGFLACRCMRASLIGVPLGVAFGIILTHWAESRKCITSLRWNLTALSGRVRWATCHYRSITKSVPERPGPVLDARRLMDQISRAPGGRWFPRLPQMRAS